MAPPQESVDGAPGFSLFPDNLNYNQVHALAAARDYRLNPTVDYSTVQAVKGVSLKRKNSITYI